LFENLSLNSLKGDLSHATTFNPPIFSLVNTFVPQQLFSSVQFFGASPEISVVDPYLGLMDPDSDPYPDPAIFVSDLQDINKKFKSFFAYYFLMVHLHHFSSIKVIKKSKNF
jgi:hypothetical protein